MKMTLSEREVGENPTRTRRCDGHFLLRIDPLNGTSLFQTLEREDEISSRPEPEDRPAGNVTLDAMCIGRARFLLVLAKQGR